MNRMMQDVKAKLITPRLVEGQPIRLSSCHSLEGYVVAMGPEDGQVTIRLHKIGGEHNLVVDAAKIEPIPVRR